MKIEGKIKNLIFIPENIEIYNSILRKFNGKDVEYEIHKIKNNRSLQQNKYYFGVVLKCFQQGYYDLNKDYLSIDDIHNFCKSKWNFKEIINFKSGEIIQIARSTADLNTFEFMIYIDEIIKFIGEWFGIEVPSPSFCKEI